MKVDVRTICCIGAGYVGGPSMAVMADKCPHIQFNVVDMNPERIESWNSNKLEELPIYEPGLSQIIERCRGKNLHFSCDVKGNISKADMIFISVNTPTKKRGLGAGQASDLKWIEACSRQIADHAKGHTIVVEKSTLPVKTALTIKSILEAYIIKGKNNKTNVKSFSILSNPEFLAEGTAINDLINPDRILIGGDDQESINSLMDIYINWISADKILTTDIWSSELSKLIANAFLAQRISSINSISALCENTEANINDVAKAVGMDSRIGEHFLNSGPGFGGSCFKKDISNLIYICNHYGLYEVASYWEQVISINEWQQKRIISTIVEKLYGTISEKKITILGFSFKSNTNDTRESPAINICKNLLEEGCYLSIYDPKVDSNQILKDLKKENINYEKQIDNSKQIETHNSVLESVVNTDAIVILTDWEEFYDLNLREIYELMRPPCWIFDTRNVINVEAAKSYGFNIWKLGNGKFK